MTKSFFGVCAVCIALAAPASADSQDAFSFLLVSPAARAAAMADAYASIAEGPEAIFSNPAGLGFNYSMHLYGQAFVPPFMENAKYTNFAFVRPMKRGSWAVHSGVLHTGSFTRTVADATAPDGYREVGDFSTYGFKLTGSVGKKVSEHFSVGTSMSFLRESLGDASANGYAVDFGMLLTDPQYPLRFGAAVQNLGPKVKFRDESHSIPAAVRAGLSWFQKKDAESLKFVPTGSQLSGEILKPLRGEQSFLGGLEVPVHAKLALRAGYRHSLKEQELGSEMRLPNGFSAGLGIQLERWNIAYALSSLGELGLVHRIAIDLRWYAHS